MALTPTLSQREREPEGCYRLSGASGKFTRRMVGEGGDGGDVPRQKDVCGYSRQRVARSTARQISVQVSKR